MKLFGSVKVFFPEYSRDELIDKLRDGVQKLGEVLSLERVVLFGSWSRGRATAFSDVDLLVVYSGPQRDDAYQLVRTNVRIRGLEPHIYTSEQAAQLPILNRMTADGVVLYPEAS